ncbi:MAG: hypothetical protein GXY28_02450 [Bacteriovoracaceae bacterium]|nr:hypothetical protein [Deltaproteobacteria bacterium]MDI9541408.1 hypothetical protein [Pseudomonadota bacterium]NLW66642.1 hypothetical protein [Bacteriovoracaceae bacterium]HRR22117.1 hypothetical protein [Desulfomonilia bacterium]HON60660.1 hypothetical protein [Deltaproteobacteria bacterium]
MASKLRGARETQRTYWVEKLARRREELREKGFDERQIEKDTAVRKLKAKITDTNLRLAAIAANEKKLEDMARLREEKKAAPQKEKGKKAAPPVEEPKAKKKKKKEEGSEQPVKKEGKKKAEKAEAAPEEKPAAAE